MEKPENCYVHLRTNQGVKLRVLFETLNPILIDSNIYFVENGMRVETMADPMYVFLHLDNIEEYVCNHSKVAGVNFANLYTYLKRAAQDDIITIQLTSKGYDSPTPYFTIFIYNPKLEYRFEHRVNLLDIIKEEYEIPQKEFDTFLDLPSQILLKILRTCEEQGDYLQIMSRASRQMATKGYVYFVTSNDMNTSFVRQAFHVPRKIEHNPGTTVRTDSDGAVMRSCDKRDRYSMRQLLLISKACGMSKSVRIYLAPEYALVIRFSVGTLGFVTFCLAQNVDGGTGNLADVINDDSDEDTKASEDVWDLQTGGDQKDGLEEPLDSQDTHAQQTDDEKEQSQTEPEDKKEKEESSVSLAQKWRQDKTETKTTGKRRANQTKSATTSKQPKKKSRKSTQNIRSTFAPLTFKQGPTPSSSTTDQTETTKSNTMETPLPPPPPPRKRGLAGRSTIKKLVLGNDRILKKD